jgi:hypothetical protein
MPRPDTLQSTPWQLTGAGFHPQPALSQPGFRAIVSIKGQEGTKLFWKGCYRAEMIRLVIPVIPQMSCLSALASAVPSV